jgi:scytalone dehydratase
MDASRAAVAIKGHAHWYRRVSGVWKFAGLCSDIRWSEYDFHRIFAGGRDEFGSSTEEVAAKEFAAKKVATKAAGVPVKA